MGIFKKKNDEDEVAVANAVPAESPEEEEEWTETASEEPKPVKKSKSLLKNLSGYLDTAQVGVEKFTEIYNTWIKPVHDNWAQIKRRLNAISTVISILFFVLYIPFLLFGKIADGLALGWEVALYVCVGVYVVTILALLIVTVASGSVTTTEMAKKRKTLSKIVLLVVRLASLAIGITALVISGSAAASPLNTFAIVIAVFSVIFSALPLVFGGMAGFFKWLISPAKIRRTFSFVLLEWHERLADEKNEDKTFKLLKKNSRRHKDNISRIIDENLIPALGAKFIHNLRSEDIVRTVNVLEGDDKVIGGWILLNTFNYAESCGYVKENICDDLDLDADISSIRTDKPAPEGEKKTVADRLSALFGRKGN